MGGAPKRVPSQLVQPSGPQGGSSPNREPETTPVSRSVIGCAARGEGRTCPWSRSNDRDAVFWPGPDSGPPPATRRVSHTFATAWRHPRPYAFRAWNSVGGVTAQRNEVWNLGGLHSIALTHLGRTNSRHLTCFDRLKDGGSRGCELEGIAIAACDNDGPPAPLLPGNGRRQEIIRLITRCFGVREAAGRNEVGQDLKLFDQLVVEVTPTLIGGKQFVPVGRLVKAVPCH